MSKSLTLSLCICVLLVFMAGCATAPPVELKDYEKDAAIKSQGVYEDCFKLDPGQSLEYVFNSSKKLDFNLHYHEDGEVMYKVDKKHVLNDSGVFNCEIEQYYCLMWTNRSFSPVTLEYEFNIRN